MVATVEARGMGNLRGLKSRNIFVVSEKFESWLREHGAGLDLDKLAELQKDYRAQNPQGNPGYRYYTTEGLTQLMEKTEKRLQRMKDELARR